MYNLFLGLFCGIQEECNMFHKQTYAGLLLAKADLEV